MFKVEVIADDSGTWVSNALRFDTEAEARAYMDTRRDDYFEYGHQVLGVEEQRVGLIQEIKSLELRLARLEATGSQWLVEDES